MTSTQTQSQTTLPAPGTYTVDPVHSTVGFVVRHLVASKVRGSFTEFDGSIVVGTTPEASSVTATVKAASIVTNQAQRDEHLRSSDFLESTTYPELTLRSKRVAPRSDGHFDLVADLTIHGVTKEVTFDLEFLGTGPGMAPNTTIVGFEASASIDRRDFDVSFNGTLENGSFVVSNKVELEFAIEASLQA
jgi:polyisoprenoid-binding protein YceI